MSLHTDQAANPLASLTWGTQPPNSRRRRRAWLAVCLPTSAYCLLVVAFFFQLVPTIFFPAQRHANWLDPEMLLMSVIYSSMLALTCVLLASILLRSTRTGPARNVWINWPDYRLAGLTGRQMLRGLSGPGFVGLFSAAAFHIALYAVCMLLAGLSDYREFDADFWSMLVIGLAPAFALILYSYLDLALWVLMPAPRARLVAATAITLATSPLAVFISFVILTANGSLMYVVYVFAAAEAGSWYFRMLIVRWLWLSAILRLDTPLASCAPA